MSVFSSRSVCVCGCVALTDGSRRQLPLKVRLELFNERRRLVDKQLTHQRERGGGRTGKQPHHLIRGGEDKAGAWIQSVYIRLKRGRPLIYLSDAGSERITSDDVIVQTTQVCHSPERVTIKLHDGKGRDTVFFKLFRDSFTT